MALLDLEGLRELQDCANYLLDHCPEARESLCQQGKENWIEQVSEASLIMLDVCNVSKDVMALVRHGLQDLQLTLRCNGSNLSEKVAAYNRYRNKLKKETLKCLNSLKSIEGGGRGMMEMQSIEQNLLFVAEVLKEVRRAVVTMVESLFSLVCVPWLERKPSIGSFSSIFTMQFCCFDDAWDEVAMRSASTRLEAAEITVEELEIELECIFRRLIQTRVSLLNILTAKTSPV
ncbi:F5M15.16 [Arabidopsis thaliana]|jgi:hypothetical protein|nr:DUF241 domain protein, putative (DUF241) [Arabidopsis thaliana]AAF79610.1 F5M15.16 [Arabidopsis thaliana]ABE65391.1 unknown [Arabidopsis thaliana]AEE29982.1 DUF241 domain protein, putative (DUF241) [Arabidopsis thaliana]CAA0225444.1 unnamed protein product [Arabidopsis thaliana]CAD5313269.1 unnamed protein product [Arabidopsis thaliana]|eukprot:NP_173476.1 DUF241 domain protein, putative (DUF241) [Arabidopsis thaliana]